MEKQPNKPNNKNQIVLKMGIGGKWEKFSKKKVVKVPEKLQPIQEVDEQEEETKKTEEKTIYVDEHGNENGSNGKGVKDTEDNTGEVKLLVTKRKEITEDENDQDIVIKTLRNVQDIIEYWIQNKQI